MKTLLVKFFDENHLTGLSISDTYPHTYRGEVETEGGCYSEYEFDDDDTDVIESILDESPEVESYFWQ